MSNQSLTYDLNTKFKKFKFHINKLFVHILDASCMVALLMVQATILNIYIINHYRNHTAYVLFVVDFITIFVFIGTLASSYTYLKTMHAEQEAADGFSFRPKRIELSPKSKFGVLPFSYLSWFFYVFSLITKITIIVLSDLTNELSTDQLMGPQFLKVTIGAASFVFLLLVEGHNWSKRGTPRHSYVTTVCAKTGIEIFDSVSILSMILDNVVPNPPKPLETTILVLVSLNFLLPGIALFNLSMSDFALTKLSLPISVLYHLFHLILVDVPFLSLRLYFWFAYRSHASMFIMKNILSITLTLRGMIPDLLDLGNEYLAPKHVSSTKHRHEPREAFEEIALNESNSKQAANV